MKWLMIGIVIFGLGCSVLKHHSYPKPCESSPLKFNKKTGLYECVDKECLYLKKGTNWTKLSPEQVINFLGKPQEKKKIGDEILLIYKLNEGSTGAFDTFDKILIIFKNQKMIKFERQSSKEPEPLK